MVSDENDKSQQKVSRSFPLLHPSIHKTSTAIPSLTFASLFASAPVFDFAAATYVSFCGTVGAGSRFFSSLEPGEDCVLPGSLAVLPSDTELTNVLGSAVRSLALTLNLPFLVVELDELTELIGKDLNSSPKQGTCGG